MDLGALTRNAAVWLPAGVPIIPMIKADAYGLGADHVVRALEELEPLAYGVATVHEGEELRSAGIARPHIIFTPILEEEIQAAHDRADTDYRRAEEARCLEIIWGPISFVGRYGHVTRGDPVERSVFDLQQSLAQNPPAGAFTHFHSAQLDDGSMAQQTAGFERRSSFPLGPRCFTLRAVRQSFAASGPSMRSGPESSCTESAAARRPDSSLKMSSHSTPGSLS